jgi:hypothetical protein
MWSSLLLLLSCAASAGGLLLQRRTARELESLRQAMRRVAASLLEASRAEDQLDELRRKQEAAEQTVQLGAAAARDLHRGIAGIPFGILEAIPATRDKTREVRAAHDDISTALYDGITLGNRVLGSLLRKKLQSRAGAEGGKDAEEQKPDPLDPGPR